MKQVNVKIGEVDVPVVEDNGEQWFPITYLSKKVLLRKGKIFFDKKYTAFFEIDYGFATGGVQEVKCVSEKGIKEYAKVTRNGAMGTEQSKAFNHLMQYLNLNKIVSEKEKFITPTSEEVYNGLNEYDQYAIKEIQDEIINLEWQLCSKCDTYYPFHIRFFKENKSSPNGLNTFCRKCGTTKDNYFPLNNKLFTKIYNDYGERVFIAYKDHDSIQIYSHSIENNIKVPIVLMNKCDYKIILRYLKESGLIDKDSITFTYLIEKHGLLSINKHLTLHEIYSTIYGEDYYLSPWNYRKFTFNDIKLTYEMANKVLKHYLKVSNVIIEDILNFDYDKLFKDARIRKLTNNDILYFLVQFYGFKYAGYQFATRSTNYYKNEDNLLFDLKHLIEEDLKIHPEKIPLYLTKNTLQRKCRPLYHFIVTQKNGSIFDWVDKLYPDKFTLQDFEINPYRNEFDSDTEAFIHEILVEEFGGNVIYNQRNNGDTVKLMGKIPDWFIFTNNGVWIVEYFGMIEERYLENSRIRDYRAKTDNKMEIYSKLNGYRYLYLYKKDVDEGFDCIREKIREVKETQ